MILASCHFERSEKSFSMLLVYPGRSLPSVEKTPEEKSTEIILYRRWEEERRSSLEYRKVRYLGDSFASLGMTPESCFIVSKKDLTAHKFNAVLMNKELCC